MNVLTDFSNFNKKKNFKIKKKCDENLDNLFSEIKVEKMKKFKLFMIKNFNMNNAFNVYKKKLFFIKL